MTDSRSMLDEMYKSMKPYANKEDLAKLEQIIKFMYTSDENLNMKTATNNPFLMASWQALSEVLKQCKMNLTYKLVNNLGTYVKELNVSDNYGKSRDEFVRLFTNFTNLEPNVLEKLVKEKKK